MWGQVSGPHVGYTEHVLEIRKQAKMGIVSFFNNYFLAKEEVVKEGTK